MGAEKFDGEIADEFKSLKESIEEAKKLFEKADSRLDKLDLLRKGVGAGKEGAEIIEKVHGWTETIVKTSRSWASRPRRF